ncbi:MAG: cytochrome c biogenesis protein CcsA [Kiritimatiellia bacterium]
MMLKTDALGWILNAQLLFVFCGAIFPRRLARVMWVAVLPLAMSAIILRWVAVGHPPMRNLFEAFLWLPLGLVLCTVVTGWREKFAPVRLDAVLGFLVAFPLAFVFSATEGQLPPALQSPLFVPHVLGYMLAYVLMARAFVLECVGQTTASRHNVAIGFFLISLALVLGSIWGNEAWGAYWQWDPKEQWSLATWLIYAAFFHVRGSRRWRLVLLGVGLLAIILTVTWINLSKLFPGMHSYAGL